MSCKLKVNTINGDVVILAVKPTETVEGLKARLVEKFPCEHPLERKILKVELLNDKAAINDAQASQTLVQAGLFSC